jgi:hypothetical protein
MWKSFLERDGMIVGCGINGRPASDPFALIARSPLSNRHLDAEGDDGE